MTNDVSLRFYLELIWRRAWMLVLGLIVGLALALVLSRAQTPLYESEARILINQPTANQILDPVTGNPTSVVDRVAFNEVELLQSQLVQIEAEQRLGFTSEVFVRTDLPADVVVVSARDPLPGRAALIAQTHAEAYLDIRAEEFVGGRRSTAEVLFDRIEELEAEISQAAAEDDVAYQTALRDDFARFYERLILTADLGNTGQARIIDNALEAESPVTPRTKRNLLIGGLLGLAGSAVLAGVLESLDRRIRSVETLEAIAPGIATLATIPRLENTTGVVALANPEGVESESFRTLRAGIDFATIDSRDIKVIQVTSARASAGKTTVAANLAVAMAQAGKRVALVDADLRRPRVHDLFGLDQTPGLSSLMIGLKKWKDAAHPMKVENGRLWVIPSGPIPPGPSELLGSERSSRTFSSLRKALDVLIVDSPPVLPVADALVLSRHVDATIVIANAESSRQDEVWRTLEQLDQAGANVVGTVLNNARTSRLASGYGYGYGYGVEQESKLRGPFRSRRKKTATRPSDSASIESADLPRFKPAETGHGGTATGASSSKRASAATRQGAEPAKGNGFKADPVDLSFFEATSSSDDADSGAKPKRS